MALNLLLIDDHPLTRLGMKTLLAQGPWPDGEAARLDFAADLDEASDLLGSRRPDLVLLKLELGNTDSRDLVLSLRRIRPGLKVVLYSGRSDGSFWTEVKHCGSKGFITSDLLPTQLVPALLSVHYGGYFCDGHCQYRPLAQASEPGKAPAGLHPLLSRREQEVLKMLAEDWSREKIANSLGISVRTVDTYRSRLMKKLEIHSLVGLTRFAIAQGISSLNPSGQLP